MKREILRWDSCASDVSRFQTFLGLLSKSKRIPCRSAGYLQCRQKRSKIHAPALWPDYVSGTTGRSPDWQLSHRLSFSSPCKGCLHNFAALLFLISRSYCKLLQLCNYFSPLTVGGIMAACGNGYHATSRPGWRTDFVLLMINECWQVIKEHSQYFHGSWRRCL